MAAAPFDHAGSETLQPHLWTDPGRLDCQIAFDDPLALLPARRSADEADGLPTRHQMLFNPSVHVAPDGGLAGLVRFDAYGPWDGPNGQE